MDQNNIIGYQGKMPWHIPEDLAWFKAQTWGHSIIMGRTTFLSLQEPLPGRYNIVLTHSKSLNHEGIRVCNSVTEVLELINDKTAFVIGGAMLYAQFLPYAGEMFITRIHATFKGDTFFPVYHPGDWELYSSQELISETGIKLSFEKLRRITLPEPISPCC